MQSMTIFMSLLMYIFPEAVCCYSQTSNFVVMFVYKVSTSSEFMCKL